MHPPFWWFADLADSENLVSSQKGAIDNSSIATEKDVPWEQQEWAKKVTRGAEYYKKKHGHVPNNPPIYSLEQVVDILKNIKKYLSLSFNGSALAFIALKSTKNPKQIYKIMVAINSV